jgi:hypothetical protein
MATIMIRPRTLACGAKVIAAPSPATVGAPVPASGAYDVRVDAGLRRSRDERGHRDRTVVRHDEPRGRRIEVGEQDARDALQGAHRVGDERGRRGGVDVQRGPREGVAAA